MHACCGRQYETRTYKNKKQCVHAPASPQKMSHPPFQRTPLSPAFPFANKTK